MLKITIKCFHVSFYNKSYVRSLINFTRIVIACKPSFPSYLAALNPTDQVFDFEELEYHYQVANRTEDVPSSSKGKLINTVIKIVLIKEITFVDGDDEDEEGDEIKAEKQEDDKTEDQQVESSPNTVTAQNNSPTIDNPYLRAAKVPKKIKSEPTTSSL